MNKKEIENLGWKYSDIFLNRMIYSLGSSNIFEHNSYIGIYHNDEFIYCDMNEIELKEYTRIANKWNDINDHPDKHTYLEATNTYNEKLDFIKNIKNKI